MRSATTIVRTAAVLWLCTCLQCGCSSANEDADLQQKQHHTTARHGHKHRHGRTKSATAEPHHRVDGLTDDVPQLTAATADGRKSESVLRKYLVRKPTGLFLSLMRTGVDTVQSSMDAFQGVSSSVFQAIKPATSRTAARSSVPPSPAPRPPTRLMLTSAESAEARRRRAATDDASRKPAATKPGLVTRLGDRVAKIVRTGIAGAEQITDLGFLVGNIGTHKIRAGLEGQDGNKEIFNLLVKYAASRVGMGAKGSPRQFVDDIGTISTFMANNEEVSKSISTVMECVVNDPQVIAAVVRMAVTMLQSSPSTECILDQLPLSPADIRLVFDVFVGSNGHAMIQTIAGLLSSLTSGPDTKEFLESLLGMMSMFKSSTGPTEDGNKSSANTGLFGSMTSLFAGGDDGGDDDDDADSATKPKKAFVGRRRGGDGRGKDAAATPEVKKQPSGVATVEPPTSDWFGDGKSDDKSASVRSDKPKGGRKRKTAKTDDEGDSDGGVSGRKRRTANTDDANGSDAEKSTHKRRVRRRRLSAPSDAAE